MSAPNTGLPMNAMMGWQEGVENKQDAVELAKGFISRRFTAQEASWYAVTPLMGGYLWEVHEGGSGKGYLDAAVRALTENPASKFWFPSGDRVFQIMMRDGKPFGILLSAKESAAVRNSGQPPLAMATRMKPAVRKGTAVMMAGAGLLGSGFMFFASAIIFYGIVTNPGPSVPAVDFSSMPHAQWSLVAGTKADEIVSKLEFKGSGWTVDKRPHPIEGLEELREERSRIINGLGSDTEMPTATRREVPEPREVMGPPMPDPDANPGTIAPSPLPDLQPSQDHVPANESAVPAAPGKPLAEMTPKERVEAIEAARRRAAGDGENRGGAE